MPDPFKALADPTRRALLLRVAEAPASVNELADNHSMSRPAVSRHLKVLEAAGLVGFDTGDADGRQRICRAELTALTEVEDYLERVRTFWENRLDRLGDYLEAQGENKE